MKPFEKGQRSVLPPGYNDAASAFFFRPRLEGSKEMGAVSPRAGDRVPGGFERGRLAGEVMRGDHSAQTRRDGITRGKVDAVFIANMGDSKASQGIRAGVASPLLIVKAQAKFDKPHDIVERGTPHKRAHVASRFCERSTARSALIAFAASVVVGSRETLAIGSP